MFTAEHGVIGLTKSAAIEYAADRVRMNAVAPHIETDKTSDAMVRRDEQNRAPWPKSRRDGS